MFTTRMSVRKDRTWFLVGGARGVYDFSLHPLISPLRPFSRPRGTSAAAKNDSSPPLMSRVSLHTHKRAHTPNTYPYTRTSVILKWLPITHEIGAFSAGKIFSCLSRSWSQKSYGLDNRWRLRRPTNHHRHFPPFNYHWVINAVRKWWRASPLRLCRHRFRSSTPWFRRPDDRPRPS